MPTTANVGLPNPITLIIFEFLQSSCLRHQIVDHLLAGSFLPLKYVSPYDTQHVKRHSLPLESPNHNFISFIHIYHSEQQVLLSSLLSQVGEVEWCASSAIPTSSSILLVVEIQDPSTTGNVKLF